MSAPDTAAILADLNRAKCVIQLRAISTALEIPAQRVASHPVKTEPGSRVADVLPFHASEIVHG